MENNQLWETLKKALRDWMWNKNAFIKVIYHKIEVFVSNDIELGAIMTW